MNLKSALMTGSRWNARGAGVSACRAERCSAAIALCLALVAALPTPAQFTATTQLVVETVTVKGLTKHPIEYDTGFTLLPGKYVIKFLARDNETGRLGTYQSAFVIPNLNKFGVDQTDKRMPISSVVLSTQRVDMRDALFNALKDKGKADAVNPLIEDGQKLVPSVTRVFDRNRDLYVYLQAYERTAETTQPLVAFVTFYHGSTKAFETAPLPVTEGLNPKSKAVPLRFSLPLTQLAPGRYDCQVTVLDPTGQKAAFWQAPIEIAP